MIERLFQNPWLLWLGAGLPALAGLMLVARARRRRAVEFLGRPFAVRRLVQVHPAARRRRALGLFLGLLCLALGIAGPRWGLRETPELLTGKDLVVVLDLSRSMTVSSRAGENEAGGPCATWRRSLRIGAGKN